MSRRGACFALVLLSAGCAHRPGLAPETAAAAAAAPAAVPQPGSVAPAADHHEHLISPAAAKLGSARPLPPVRVPAALARLLHERGQRWNDTATLAELYTDSSIVFDARWPDWWRGRSAVATHLTKRFARPYALTPTAYEVTGSGGYVTGYYTRGEGEDAKHFGHYVLSLARGPGGVWRIAAETPSFPGPDRLEPHTAEQLVAQMDSAGIRRAVVLSTAYWFGSRFRDPPLEDEYARTRAENDWTAEQAARFPDRLVAFCSFNPLRDYALAELDRCAEHPGLRGLKLHFGNSGVDVRDPEHVEKLRRVFRAANRHGLPIVAHLWTDPSYEKEGGQHAEIFLDQILPEAPDVTVQVAHMAGGGRSTDPALAVLADAIAAGDPRTKNLYFDVATLTGGQSDEGLEKDAVRMRQIGLERILWGSDRGPARQPWRDFRALMPLSAEEIRTIAGNVAPYLR